MLHREKVLEQIVGLLGKAEDRELRIVLAFVSRLLRKEK